MAGISASLDIDYSEALSGVDTLGAALDTQLAAAVSSFEEQMSGALAAAAEVPIAVDTSQIPDEIAAALATDPQEIPVDADTSAAEAAINTLVTSADGETATLDVEADTSGAEQSISDVGSSASSARGEVGGLAIDAGLLGTAMGAAKGNVAGTAESLSAGLGPLSAFGGGLLAVGAATAGFVEVGEKAHAATERLNLVFGDAAPEAMAVNIGGLNGDLNELAIKAGSSGAQLRQATASLGQVAIAAGDTQEQAAGVVGQFQALALRAVAMNPQLGEAGDVMGRLVPALSRGGKFAANFGLSLSSAEISARALSDTGKTAATDLTVLEKATAGAEIATERLGDNLGKDFSNGADQAAVKLKSLKAEIVAGFASIGVPLVEPILELAQAFTPLALAIGQAVGKLVTGLVPAMGALIPIVTPLASVIGVVGDVLGALGPILPAVTIGFVAFEAVTQLLPIAIGGATTAALLLTDVLPLTATAAATAAAGIETAEVAVSASLGPIGLLVAGLGIAATAFGGFGDDSKSAKDATKEFADELAKTADSALATKFTSAIDKAVVKAEQFGISIDSTKGALQRFRDIAGDNVGTAQRLLDSLKAAGENTKGYQAIVDKAVQSQKDQSAAQSDTDATTQQLTGDTSAQSAAQDDLNQKIESYVSTVTGGMPSVTSSFNDVSSALANFGVALSPEALITALQTSLDESLNFTRNLKVIFDAGFTDVGALLSQEGAKAGGGIAASLAVGIASGSPEVAKQLNDQAQAVNIAGAIAANNATAQGAAVVANTQSEYEKLAPFAASVLGLTADEFQSRGPEIAAQAAAAASFGYNAFATGVAPIPGAAGQSVTDAGGAMQASGGAVGSTAGPAYQSGFGVGQAFTLGLIVGMESLLGDVIGEAAHLVVEAEKSARTEAKSHSPSQLFADIGRDLSLGLAQGMEATAKTVVVPASREVINHAAAQAGAAGGGGRGPLTVEQTLVFQQPTNPTQAVRMQHAALRRAATAARLR